MAGFRISVHGSKELQAVLVLLRHFDRDAQSQLNKQTRSVVEPIWKEAVAARVTDRVDSRVIANTARASVTRSNVTLKAGQIGKTLSGGAKPADLIHAEEFGADREKYTRYLGRRGGKSFPVTRRTARQFPARHVTGRVVYPAAAEIIPRVASLWVQTIVRTFHEALEGK